MLLTAEKSIAGLLIYFLLFNMNKLLLDTYSFVYCMHDVKAKFQ